jgi:hypothetical protein
VRLLLSHLGLGGLAALAIVVAAGSFQVGVQEPLEEELRVLERSVGSIRSRTPRTNANTPSSQMGGFYRFFEHPLSAHEWLAKLHGIGRASGVELPSADYRVTPTGTPITRYQLTLPLNSTYSQARAFMANALNEIPVLSVDQASFRRTRAGDPRLEVEIVMTFHLLDP